jgi:hypothetical protein
MKRTIDLKNTRIDFPKEFDVFYCVSLIKTYTLELMGISDVDSTSLVNAC